MSGNRNDDEQEQAPADEREERSDDREQEFERNTAPKPATTTNPRIKST
ncbi:hypothetical protein [Pinirhizobacter sp.]|jgi:hypothetical protein